MHVTIRAHKAIGAISIPASKSYSQRALVAALLHNGTSIIKNIGTSNDEKTVLEIIQQLGAQITKSGNEYHIISNGELKPSSTISCNESGLATRLISPILALSSQEYCICASGSLQHRKMLYLNEFFDAIGVQFTSQNEQLPFKIKGPIQVGNRLTITRVDSSQILSGLLFALSALNRTQAIVLEVQQDIPSFPYIAMSIDVLAHFGKKINIFTKQQFEIAPSTPLIKSTIEYTVEADWSSAAYWIAAACIQGAIQLKGLNPNSLQADKKMLEIAQQIGATIYWQQDVLMIESNLLKCFESNLEHCPDLFPILAILAACCEGKSTLYGTHRLSNKESARADEISKLLHLLKVPHLLENNSLEIWGLPHFPNIQYNCPNDHRMAMAAALCSLRTDGAIEIMNAECVDKSYPEFWQHLQAYCTE